MGVVFSNWANWGSTTEEEWIGYPGTNKTALVNITTPSNSSVYKLLNKTALVPIYALNYWQYLLLILMGIILIWLFLRWCMKYSDKTSGGLWQRIKKNTAEQNKDNKIFRPSISLCLCILSIKEVMIECFYCISKKQRNATNLVKNKEEHGSIYNYTAKPELHNASSVKTNPNTTAHRHRGSEAVNAATRELVRIEMEQEAKKQEEEKQRRLAWSKYNEEYEDYS